MRIVSNGISAVELKMFQIMDEYGVEIRFPRSTDPDPNLVVVAGKDENAVYDCIDQLRREEEDFLQVRGELRRLRIGSSNTK